MINSHCLVSDIHDKTQWADNLKSQRTKTEAEEKWSLVLIPSILHSYKKKIKPCKISSPQKEPICQIRMSNWIKSYIEIIEKK